MSTNFNVGLCEEIQTEMLKCTGLIQSIMTNTEGEFKLFVRKGSLQKAWPVPRKNVSGLNDDDEEGIRYSLYKDLVNSVVTTLSLQDEAFDFGYILISYKANNDGDELEDFQLRFQDEIHFAREQKKK